MVYEHLYEQYKRSGGAFIPLAYLALTMIIGPMYFVMQDYRTYKEVEEIADENKDGTTSNDEWIKVFNELETKLKDPQGLTFLQKKKYLKNHQ